MSNDSFKVKKALTLTPQDLTLLVSPEAGDIACDVNDSNKIKRYDSLASSWKEVGSGGGVGGVDILFAQSFEEVSLASFTQTGLVLDGTSPLHGVVSALLVHQAGVPQSFKQVIAVDRKFRGLNQVLELNIKSNATAGNVTISVFDETNAATILASTQLNLSTDTSGRKDSVAFTIPLTCASLSYTITALQEAGSPETRIDDIVCQINTAALLETSVTVPVLTAWQSYIPTFQGLGSPSAIEMQWRQNGQNAEIRGKFTSGVSTAVEARIGLPAGLSSAGTGVIPSIQQVGKAIRGNASSSSIKQFAVTIQPSVTYLTLGRDDTTSASNPFTPSNGDALILNGEACSFFASVPCAGLSATVDKVIPLTQSGLIQEADSVLYAAGNGGQILTALVINIPFNLVSSEGSALQWNGNSFTVLKSGVISIDGSSYINAAGTNRIYLYTNGTQTRQVSDSIVNDTVLPFNYSGKFNQGDEISFRYQVTVTLVNNPVFHYISITQQGSLKQVSVSSDQKIKIPTSELRFEGASTRGSTDTVVIKFDTLAKIRGDAFSVTSTSTNGTAITMLKAGRLSVSAGIYLTGSGSAFYLSKNLSNLTGSPTASEMLFSSYVANALTILNSTSWTGSVAVGDVLRLSANVTPTGAVGNQVDFSFQEQDISVSVTNTLPQFSESDSSVRVDTANGYGSTGTKIRRFSNVRDNLGVDVEYVDSAVNGASFTAKSAGIYYVSYSDGFTTACTFGLSKNAASLTTNIGSIATASILTLNSITSVNTFNSCSWEGYLEAGDIVRPHGDGIASFGTAQAFTMSKVGKPNVTGVDVTPFVNLAFDKGSIGEIKAFAGNVDGAAYLACDGSAVNRGSYSELFRAIGTTHGQGDGSTTFNLPDYRGRFLRGVDAGSGNDPDAATRTAMNTGGNTGNTVGSVQADENLLHGHLFRMGSGTGAGGYVGGLVTDNGVQKTSTDHTGAASATDGDQIAGSGGSESRPKNAYVNYGIRFKAANEAILTVPETFSTDTAALSYAGSAEYTLATLTNAPVGKYITFTYAASTNTRVQTTVRPTQTDSHMNANGIQIFTRAFNAASTAGNPAAIAIQIGKGLKGQSLGLYKSAGKVTAGSTQSEPIGDAGGVVAYRGLALQTYDEATGIMYLDSANTGSSSTTSFNYLFTDLTTQTNGYLVINASKNPALVGISLPRVYSESGNNAGQVVTANVTDIPFIGISDTNGAWNGSQYVVPETGVYTVSGSIYLTTSASRGMYLYIGGASSYSIGRGELTVGPYAITRRFNKGDILSIRTNVTSTLLANGTIHYINITKVSN
jgi:microcystin-dependent protein